MKYGKYDIISIVGFITVLLHQREVWNICKMGATRTVLGTCEAFLFLLLYLIVRSMNVLIMLCAYSYSSTLMQDTFSKLTDNYLDLNHPLISYNNGH